MGEAFHNGGWGMFPTALMGLVLLVAAALYAARPDVRRLGVTIALAVMTLLAGTLGFVTGLMKTLDGAGNHKFEGSSVDIAMIGTSESLNNIALALVLLVLATILVTIGAGRQRAATAAPAERIKAA